eukprot:GHRR01024143.1.p1 GENE.GHRR01024143.1~~GHRR01024143.1.p1  ORF type:complete len:114 (-),score=4.39 GHRR01024143.1:8-349(-)
METGNPDPIQSHWSCCHSATHSITFGSSPMAANKGWASSCSSLASRSFSSLVAMCACNLHLARAQLPTPSFRQVGKLASAEQCATLSHQPSVNQLATVGDLYHDVQLPAWHPH